LLSKVQQLSEGHEIVYAYLGVMVSTPTPQQRHEAGVASDIGVKIDSVEPDAPAGTCGIQPDDFVLSIGGKPVRDNDTFVQTIGSASTTQPVTLELRRDGKPMSIEVTLRKRQLAAAVTSETQRFHWRGLTLGPVPANWQIEKSQLPGAGVMVFGIDSNSPLLKQGISTGTIITAIGNRAVKSIVDLQQALNDLPAEQCAVTIAHPNDAVAAK
jgi:serine protease Do